MKADRNLKIAERLDRLSELDLFLVEVEIVLFLCFLGDFLGADRTEHFSVTARFHLDHNRDLFELLRQFLSICQLCGCFFRLSLFLQLQVVFVLVIGLYSQLLGNDKVPCVSVADVDNISLFAE